MIILDGGLGRQLKAMGAPFRQPEWSALALMEGPEFVRAAHDAFIESGATIITTNSYAVVPFHIGEDLFRDQAGALLDLAGQLARDAADAAPHPVQVAAGVPPMFGSYQPDKFDAGRATEMIGLFRQKLDPYADFFMAETHSSIAEALCFLTVFADCDKPVWLSLTLEDANPVAGTPQLRSGEPLTDLLAAIDDAPPSAVLFNCSQPEVMDDAIRTVVTHFAGKAMPPLVGVLANAFPLIEKTYSGANATLHDLRGDITPSSYADYAVKWAASGADIIGGCCGISPDHLREVKNRLIG
ncbi:MAG: homocysteine S-methyltransferase family protein [Alphaproteobacteria bacterium]|jgi:S-methylmethionine-dependent homocysteine/selenocysteine methylase|nr:homocysteine S-methyltransferase family protein [Alphaproteobacteria bacterium]